MLSIVNYAIVPKSAASGRRGGAVTPKETELWPSRTSRMVPAQNRPALL